MGSDRNPRRAILPQDARALQGVWLFLLALSVFFLASLLLYVFYIAMRIKASGVTPQPLQLPTSFVPSTCFLLAISAALELAMRSARKSKTKAVLRMLIAAMVFSILFLIFQSEGMVELIRGLLRAKSANESPYGYTFILAFLHALHVVGGVIGLLIVTLRAFQDAYDHERNFGLKFCAMYWHFLDIVWLVMLTCFFAARGYLEIPVSML